MDTVTTEAREESPEQKAARESEAQYSVNCEGCDQSDGWCTCLRYD